MRAVLLAVLLIAPAAPALAHPYEPACQRRINTEALQPDADRVRAEAREREARAREQRGRTETTTRPLQDGELAGGPSATGTTWRASPVTTPPPPILAAEAAPVPELTGDAARMDELMAQAMARSTARVRAMTGDRPR
jgi:hypothetical protein